MFRSACIGHHDVPAALDRRDMLKTMTAVVGGAAAAGFNPAVVGPTAVGASPRPQGDPNTTRFFPGFKTFRVPGAGAEIHGVIGGQGPPLLLLHGAPQTHVSWSLVAPRLAAEYTVVAADLRGYGDSSKPPDGESHVNYSKRAMGLDQVEVMRHFGFDYVYTHVTLEIIQAYYTWFSNARRAPVPEEELKSSYEVRSSRATSEIQLEYLRTASDPANIHAMCEDYRAAASIDLKHEEADPSKKVLCPLLALWGERSPNTQPHDVLGLWRDRAIKVTGRAMPSGHDVQIDAPDLFVAELRAFLKA